MASPLAWFRRNQKGMLIVFGVLLMAVFGLPSVFFNMTPQGGANPEMAENVVKYKGGSFTRGEFRDYRFRNAQAVRFVQSLRQATLEQMGDSYRQRAPMFTAIDTGGSPEELDRRVMRRIILKKKADELGMAVGDEAVLDYLRAIGSDDITFRDMEQFAFELFRGSPDFNTIKEQLKKEITVQQMFGIVASGMPRSPSVTQAWESFLKLNKRRAATVLEFPVDRFVSQVAGEPSLAELREIFAEGQYNFADPFGKIPGFKSRQKVKTAVLTANLQDFITSAEAAIKPEDIQKLYDEYVEQKHPLVMEFVPTEPAEGEPGDDPAPEFDLGGEDETGDGEEAMDTESGDSSTGEDSADSSESSEENSDEPEVPENNEEGKGDGETGDDGLPDSGPSANWQEEQEEQEEKSDEKSDEASQEKSNAEANQEAGESSESMSEAIDQESGQQDPATEPASEPAGPELPGDTVQVPDGPPGGGLSIDDLGQQPERRVKPLDEELSKLLKRELARKPASIAMSTAITEAAGDIGDYGGDLTAWETTKDGPLDERQEKPEPINLESVARDYKLQFQETELLNYVELRETPVGQISVAVQRFMRGLPLADYLFSNYYQMNEWVPETVVEAGTENQHVVVFVEKADTKVRSFDEARDDVIKFWKRQQAIKLAEEAAQKVADEVNSSNEKLAEKFPADANDVGEFTYNVFSRPPYPLLNEDVRTGPDFMETAFGLEVGKAGVAVDATRDNVYLIQVSAEDTRTEEELRKLFFDELATSRGMSQRITTLYEVDTEEFINKYFRDIDKEMDIKWLAH